MRRPWPTRGLTPQNKKKSKMLSSLMFEHGAHAVTDGPGKVKFLLTYEPRRE